MQLERGAVPAAAAPRSHSGPSRSLAARLCKAARCLPPAPALRRPAPPSTRRAARDAGRSARAGPRGGGRPPREGVSARGARSSLCSGAVSMTRSWSRAASYLHEAAAQVFAQPPGVDGEEPAAAGDEDEGQGEGGWGVPEARCRAVLTRARDMVALLGAASVGDAAEVIVPSSRAHSLPTSRAMLFPFSRLAVRERIVCSGDRGAPGVLAHRGGGQGRAAPAARPAACRDRCHVPRQGELQARGLSARGRAVRQTTRQGVRWSAGSCAAGARASAGAEHKCDISHAVLNLRVLRATLRSCSAAPSPPPVQSGHVSSIPPY